MRYKKIFSVFLFFCSGATWAIKFSNQFTEFELPPNWQCRLERAEWICQNTTTNKIKEAVIVLAAKLKSDQDSLDQYVAYLKNPKIFTSPKAGVLKSIQKYTKTVNINGKAWVDSLHYESELAGYFTRYFATVYQDIGVLITYSVEKSKYTDYLHYFDNMIKTLKVFRKQGGINTATNNMQLFPSLNAPISGLQLGEKAGSAVEDSKSTDQKNTNASSGNDLLIWALVLVVCGIFILRRFRR